ncbi:MAG: RagB/SusD family nutrient uptake outer membrane protein [Bacteroidales bacterium]|mgnify:FL=1|uniref:RagB/SusD family nutrient uptake outer membrane protein n=1 Tax=Candidatus Cryptobacteroides bacterium TaxID=3085639 RepID=UPI002E9D7004|nr:RagB/SusD family nutrient uptake outer membrane protein [Bacteroidales bacterium]
MKNRIYTIIACFLATVIYSCSDVLNQAPDGKISLEEVFGDNDKTMYYLNTCYSGINAKGCLYFFWSRGPVNWCDDSWDADDLDVSWAASRRYYDGNASASDFPANYNAGDSGNESVSWARSFQRIRNCAVFLQNIPNAKVNSESDRSRWTAEAHILRAYYYSELLMWFGCSLPIIREPYTYDADFSKVERSSFHDVVEFIVEDCDAALACEELPWRITTDSEAMRMTKAVAWAIKSRMTLFAASPLYNDGNNYWEEAYSVNKAAVQALESNGYALYDKLNQAAVWGDEKAYLPTAASQYFNEYFCNSGAYAADPADKETIYQLRDGANLDLANVDGIGAILGYKTGTCPSQELVDAFETIDGQPVLDLAKPYLDEQHLKPNYNSSNTTYDKNNPYANRDPRFYATVYYNGSKRYCNWSTEAEKKSFENLGQGKGENVRIITTWDAYEDAKGNIINSPEPLMGRSMTGRTPTRTGYFQRKFLHPNSGVEMRLNGARHKDYRLAEIYLNFAEAAMEAGHTDEAITYVNKVRARAGMPGLPAGLSGENLRQRIHNERRVEFALEGNRYFDVRRWHKPDEDLSATDRWITGAHITHMQDGTYKYERTILKERQCYTNKWLKMPIPLTEVNNMRAITGEDWQNPGW